MPIDQAVHDALRGVIDPELGDNIVDLGMVKRIEIADDGRADITISLTTAGCPLRAQLMDDVRRHASKVPGVSEVAVHFGEMTADQKKSLMARARWKARDPIPTDIPMTTRVIAVASGKGGVGKSSVSANLAVALASRGLIVGVLDADIGGYSIPRMLGIDGKVSADKDSDGAVRMHPIEKRIGDGTLRVVSMGSIEGAEEDEAIMLRGLMLNRAVQHFLEDVAWGDLDYLIIDMPPGTSDIQMGLARMLPRSEVVIVTTPALGAQKVATRAADMAQKGYLRVAGVIENMTSFTCTHGDTYALFGEGGGERLAADIGVPLLGQIPLSPAVASGGDSGAPVALSDDPAGVAFVELADVITAQEVPATEMAGCTARLLESVEAALGPK
ncbi:MAG TPA: Mrp/NBP35 family ATP-binding protein [Acidimicrobiales bacterium]|nr:Mrp/NBP35 family ATP-binding protein [Acidimicrobiales bacterium]